MWSLSLMMLFANVNTLCDLCQVCLVLRVHVNFCGIQNVCSVLCDVSCMFTFLHVLFFFSFCFYNFFVKGGHVYILPSILAAP